MVVGITSGIGSGKSTVVEMFLKFENVVGYFADIEAKKLMNSSEKIKLALINEFSEEVYKNNQLNRTFLADIVFKNKEKLATLNAIVHPVVHEHFQTFIQKNKGKIILYENAILFEIGNDKICNKIITVTAPIDVKLERVMQRDNNSKEQVLARMKNQWSDAKKIMSSNYIIENIELTETQKQVEQIYKKLNNDY